MKIAHFEQWPSVDLLNRDVLRGIQRQEKTEWLPAVDIIEEKARFVLRADLPGVAAADIDVSMDAGILTVSGARHAEELGEDTGVQRQERQTGQFLRRFTLPDTADADNIAAKSSNGILEVSIPKKAQVQARRISVEAA